MRDAERLSVLVVDEQELIYCGLRLVLSREPWAGRCVHARAGEQAIALAHRYRPHVAVIDLWLGDEPGVELCERLRRERPDTRVLLTSGSAWLSTRAARQAGASGFVPKACDVRSIALAVRHVGEGRTAFVRRPERRRMFLSQREREVLALMSCGATNKEIGQQLLLSPETVKTHARSLYAKLQARNRAQAIHRADRLGLTGEGGPGPRLESASATGATI